MLKHALRPVLLGVGFGIVLVCFISEFFGVEWWSSVNLARLEQEYLVFVRGQVFLGHRGTAGFFSRRIPAAGWGIIEAPLPLYDPWLNRVLPREICVNQNSGYAVPMLPLGLAALVAALATRRRHRPGRCGVCGYDLVGLVNKTCPECGTLPRA